MITGEEQPDEGQVSIDRAVKIGYFSQDVGDMSGRSAVAEVMDGVGPVSALAAEMAELEAAMTHIMALLAAQYKRANYRASARRDSYDTGAE